MDIGRTPRVTDTNKTKVERGAPSADFGTRTGGERKNYPGDGRSEARHPSRETKVGNSAHDGLSAGETTRHREGHWTA